MKKLLVYLPCYNEEENIGILIDLWTAEKDTLLHSGWELQVTAIDDCSTDQTLPVIQEKARLHDHVHWIAHEKNRNLGGVLKTAVSAFLHEAEEGDLMAFMDGDNTHQPYYIHRMLSEIREGEPHCVIASRYRKGSHVIGLRADRRLLSRFAKIYYQWMLRVPQVRDYTCGYRLYTFPALRTGQERWKDALIEEQTFACMMEFLYKLYLTGCTFSEIPFDLHYEKKKGDSKLQVSATIRNSLSAAFRLRRQRRK